MPLLSLDQACLQYGTHVLLDKVEFNLNPGDRIGLLGRNGAGKSTLMKVIRGDIVLESGKRWVRDGIRISYLDQSLPGADEQDVYDVVAGGLADVGELLKRYHHSILEGDMDTMASVQTELEAKDGWRLAQKVETVISQLQLPANASMSTLSGGWRRRCRRSTRAATAGRAPSSRRSCISQCRPRRLAAAAQMAALRVRAAHADSVQCPC